MSHSLEVLAFCSVVTTLVGMRVANAAVATCAAALRECGVAVPPAKAAIVRATMQLPGAKRRAVAVFWVGMVMVLFGVAGLAVFWAAGRGGR